MWCGNINNARQVMQLQAVQGLRVALPPRNASGVADIIGHRQTCRLGPEGLHPRDQGSTDAAGSLYFVACICRHPSAEPKREPSMKLQHTLVVAALIAVSGAANAQLTFDASGTFPRTEQFNGVAGLPTFNFLTPVELGALVATGPGTITFTYLGQESRRTDSLHLLINGTSLLESNAVGSSISAIVSAAGAIDFSFQDDQGGVATNGGSFSAGTSIGRINATTVATGAAQGSYAFILGYNDSAGSATLGDWDDFVVGVNFEPMPAVPEPASYALMLAGLGTFAALARRRKG